MHVVDGSRGGTKGGLFQESGNHILGGALKGVVKCRQLVGSPSCFGLELVQVNGTLAVIIMADKARFCSEFSTNSIPGAIRVRSSNGLQKDILS